MSNEMAEINAGHDVFGFHIVNITIIRRMMEQRNNIYRLPKANSTRPYIMIGIIDMLMKLRFLSLNSDANAPIVKNGMEKIANVPKYLPAHHLTMNVMIINTTHAPISFFCLINVNT